MSLLRSVVVIVGIGVAGSAAVAQVPERMSYQGVLTDAAGELITASLPITFRLYAAAEGGSSLWSETVEADVVSGLFGVELGVTRPLSQDLFSSGDARWLALAIDDDSEMTPRQSLGSTPYALLAATAGSVKGGTVDVSSIAVGGVPVIDRYGNWVGPLAWLGTRLSDLGCVAGDSPVYDGTAWVCASSNGGAPLWDDVIGKPALGELASSQTWTGVNTFTRAVMSTVSNGTAPFSVLSTTTVTNLGADQLDGHEGSHYLDLAQHTGLLSVARGGTGLTSGTSGGVPYYSSSASLASSSVLTNNAVMLGGGAAGAPKTLTATNANSLLGTNSGNTTVEYKQVVAGTGIGIVHGAGSITLSATGGSGVPGRMMLGTWAVTNLNAGVTDQRLQFPLGAGMWQDVLGSRMAVPYAGIVRGICVAGSGECGAGTARFRVFRQLAAGSTATYIGDAASDVIIDSTNKQFRCSTGGTMSVAAGDVLDIRVTTGTLPAWSPTNMHFTAQIVYELSN